jgi:nucleoside-diphosphate-sugar epimerase
LDIPIQLKRRYNLNAPQGVRGRSSDNTLIQKKLGWSPEIPLAEGLALTYEWIFEQREKELKK